MFKQYKDTQYDIYDDGRCFSRRTNKFLKPNMSKTYPSYNLVIDGKKCQVKAHRMVAETFVTQPAGRNLVKHIDGNTHNFRANNLRWVSGIETNKHEYFTGLHQRGDTLINNYIENWPNEKWANIKDFPLYLVSSLGRVMNIKTKKLVNFYIDENGRYVYLWKNNKNKCFYIQELVYSNFAKDYDLKNYELIHIDGNKFHNVFSNLKKIEKEIKAPAPKIKKLHNACKPVEQYDLEGNFINEYPSLTEASKQTGIATIGRLIKRNNGQAGGYIWKFK